jgi:hypothetical protein
MKRTRTIFRGRIALGLLYSSCILSACKPNGPPSYLSFSRHRSQTYYAGFADACDQLIAKIGVQGTNEVRVSGNDGRLPPLLLDMHSTYINVWSNQVWMVVDIDVGYGVVWHAGYLDSNRWELTVLSEAEPKEVFTRTKR